MVIVDELPDLASFTIDKPLRVTAAKLCSDQIIVTIEWEKRTNGFQPKASNFSNKLVREECPKLLVDFYESRINSK